MLKEKGATVKWLAEQNEISQSYCYALIQRGKDACEHIPDIRLVMNGVVGECRHGSPTIGGIPWWCLDCEQSNQPNHRELFRGRINKSAGAKGATPIEETASEVVEAVQPHGPAKFIPRGGTTTPKESLPPHS